MAETKKDAEQDADFDFFQFVRERLNERSGDVEKTRNYLLRRIRADARLRRSIIEEAIHIAVRTHIGNVRHVERTNIFRIVEGGAQTSTETQISASPADRDLSAAHVADEAQSARSRAEDSSRGGGARNGSDDQRTASPADRGESGADGGAQQHAEIQCRNSPAAGPAGVAALARGVAGVMSHFRLPNSNKYLKDATREDVLKAAEYYESYERSAGHKARWLRRIGADVAEGAVVSDHLGEDKIVKIWKDTE